MCQRARVIRSRAAVAGWYRPEMRIAVLVVVAACRSGAAPVVPVAHAMPAAAPLEAPPRSPLDEVALAAARSAADDDVVSSEAVRRAMTAQLGSALSPH